MAYPFSAMRAVAFPVAFDNPPTPEVIATALNERGPVWTRGNAAFQTPNEVVDAIAGMAALKSAWELAVPKVNAVINDYLPSVAETRIRALVKSDLAAPFQQAQESAISYLESHLVNLAKFEALPPVVDATIESAKRQKFESIGYPNQLQWLQSGPIDDVVAVARVGLPPEQHQIALNRIRVHNLANADAVVTTFVQKPSLSDPIARGMDAEKIDQYCLDAVKAWEAKWNVINIARITLQNFCTFVAALTGTTPQQAYDLLTGAE